MVITFSKDHPSKGAAPPPQGVGCATLLTFLPNVGGAVAFGGFVMYPYWRCHIGQ